MDEKLIRIRLLRHEDSDLITAVSDDLRGLVVHGYSESEINERMPGAIKDILEGYGFSVASVQQTADASPALDPHEMPAFIANASLAHARS